MFHVLPSGHVASTEFPVRVFRVLVSCPVWPRLSFLNLQSSHSRLFPGRHHPPHAFQNSFLSDFLLFPLPPYSCTQDRLLPPFPSRVAAPNKTVLGMRPSQLSILTVLRACRLFNNILRFSSFIRGCFDACCTLCICSTHLSLRASVVRLWRLYPGWLVCSKQFHVPYTFLHSQLLTRVAGGLSLRRHALTAETRALGSQSAYACDSAGPS